MMDREDVRCVCVCVCVCVMKYYSATKMKSCHLQQHGWTLKSYAKVNVRWGKTNTAWFHSYMEYKNKQGSKTKINKQPKPNYLEIPGTEHLLPNGTGARGVWNGPRGSVVWWQILNFWWWAHCTIYGRRNITFYTWYLC